MISIIIPVYNEEKTVLNILKSIDLSSDGFEIEAEITAKLLRKNIKIIEIPIPYIPRRYKEGKHIRAKDGFIGFWTLLKNRF